jgi:Na+-transporting methylmalonyl-CoA/oxaloacetate decarboxylase gamma subunit
MPVMSLSIIGMAIVVLVPIVILTSIAYIVAYAARRGWESGKSKE